MTPIDVRCEPGDEAWGCVVDLATTHHEVRVTRDDLDRLDPAAPDPVDLVRRSFEFLLAREPPSSILRSFDLMVIGRYFPEYERAIRRVAS